ncbi:MAG: HPr family phosphocarrier protein [Alphaproteobacteria bacterium]|nr:HPr family phosphocarrier protein [Alphaproteobacteria bacterium]
MSENICSIELEIQNKKGLHARAAAAFVKCAEEFDADITVERLGQVVSGCSIMGLMMLAASQGTTIKVCATGNQADEAVKSLSLLVNCKFGEE